MFVERVDGAGSDRERLARRDIHDLALTRDAIVRLEMVLVVQVRFRTLMDTGLMDRVAHAVGRDDHPLAVPSRPGDVAGGVCDIFGADHDHHPNLTVTPLAESVGAAADARHRPASPDG